MSKDFSDDILCYCVIPVIMTLVSEYAGQLIHFWSELSFFPVHRKERTERKEAIVLCSILLSKMRSVYVRVLANMK